MSILSMAFNSKGKIFALKFHILIVILNTSIIYAMSFDPNGILLNNNKDVIIPKDEINQIESVLLRPDLGGSDQHDFKTPAQENSASNSGTPNRFLLKDPHTNRQHVAKKSIFDPLSCNDDDLDGEVTKVCQNCIKITRAVGAYDACCTNKRNAFKWCKRIYDFTFSSIWTSKH